MVDAVGDLRLRQLLCRARLPPGDAYDAHRMTNVAHRQTV